VPLAYHTERLRNAMLDDLRTFAHDQSWPRGQFQSRTEEPFSFVLDPSLEISGKIDRIDTDASGRTYIIDYKYRAAQRTKAKLTNANLLQAPLYLMGAEKALGVKPAGMFYVGLKAGVEYVGWSDSGFMKSVELQPDWLEKTAQRTLEVAAEIRAGRIEPRPADVDSCRFCDFRDVCRVQIEAAGAAGSHRHRSPAYGYVRGCGSGIGEDHGAGGILPAAGRGERGPDPNSGDHVHRKSGREYAQEAGGGFSGPA
jgi:CRISPR/Cas system-associated exonuclease Cas4 (RecB family)